MSDAPTLTPMDVLLSPRSIAIIGASPDPKIIRGKIQYVLQGRKFPGRIYPISRSHPEVQGQRAYASLSELPEQVDLAIIIIPAADVPESLEACGQAGIKAVIVISSGFAEESTEIGPALQARMAEIAKRYGMAVLGPNAQGYFNAAAQVAATFSPAVEHFDQPIAPDTEKGRRVAVVAQSGGLCFAFYHRGRPRQLRFNFAISTGNEAVLDSFQAVEHLIDRDGADVILMYVESIKSEATFRRVAGKAADRRIPLILAKVGRSEVGRRAVAAHTASIAGSDAEHEAWFREYGVIRADDTDTMLDIALAFAYCPLPKGPRVAVVSGSGGGAAWMSDALVAQGLEVPLLEPESRDQILAMLPAYGSAANPVDLTAAAVTKAGFPRVIDILQASPVIDSVVVVGSVANPKGLNADQEGFSRVCAHPDKPVLYCAYTLAPQEAVDTAAVAGLPVYSSMPNCVRALRALYHYRIFMDGWRQRSPTAVRR